MIPDNWNDNMLAGSCWSWNGLGIIRLYSVVFYMSKWYLMSWTGGCGLSEIATTREKSILYLKEDPKFTYIGHFRDVIDAESIENEYAKTKLT